MERDLELIKTILLYLEKDRNPFVWKDKIIGTDDKVKFNYHIKILHESGLIEAKDLSTKMGLHWIPVSLTWQGHDFLDAAKNDTAWNKMKEVYKEKGGSIPFVLIKELLVGFIKSQLNF